MAFAVAMWSYAGAVHAWLLIGLLLYTIVLFAEMMADHVKVRIEMIALCYVAGAIVPFLLSSLIRILTMTTGRYVVLIPFAIAFLSDGGAYFAGLKFGKHKLAPVVSPNKTIEGALGGLIAAMLGMLIYALVLDLAFSQFRVNYGIAILYGLVGSLVGVFGDLCFSIIKRQTGIKDYGNLIPGHGGVLDRFDSMMMVAPLVESLLLLAPVVI
jgi:phosphatidate cytidylyltransferase